MEHIFSEGADQDVSRLVYIFLENDQIHTNHDDSL